MPAAAVPLLLFLQTKGNADDRESVERLCRNLSGSLYADKGYYISQELFGRLYVGGIRLVMGIRFNMKNRLMPLMDKLALRKRSLIETINDGLKNICDIAHTRHWSLANFLVNLVSELVVAYTFRIVCFFAFA